MTVGHMCCSLAALHAQSSWLQESCKTDGEDVEVQRRDVHFKLTNQGRGKRKEK